MQRFKRKTDSKGVGPHFFLLLEPAGQKAGHYTLKDGDQAAFKGRKGDGGKHTVYADDDTGYGAYHGTA